MDIQTVGAAMMGIVVWSTIAWYYGLPTSESHGLVAGLAGAGLATAGPDALLWEGWKKVLIGIVFSSFLGFFVGLFFMIGILWVVPALERRPRVKKVFGRLQIVSAAFMAFSHGSNDGQKFIGVFTLALMLGGGAAASSRRCLPIPLWVILMCAVTMGVGHRHGRLADHQDHGPAPHQAGARPRLRRRDRGRHHDHGAPASLGIPLSTTHTISTTIMGVGSTRGLSAVKWGVAGSIVAAWILTFPICGLIAYVTTKLVR